VSRKTSNRASFASSPKAMGALKKICCSNRAFCASSPKATTDRREVQVQIFTTECPLRGSLVFNETTRSFSCEAHAALNFFAYFLVSTEPFCGELAEHPKV
jgi:hypothetical protein